MAEIDGCWDVAMIAPSLTPLAIAAKLRLLSEMLHSRWSCGGIEKLFHAITADASRLADGRGKTIIQHSRIPQ